MFPANLHGKQKEKTDENNLQLFYILASLIISGHHLCFQQLLTLICYLTFDFYAIKPKWTPFEMFSLCFHKFIYDLVIYVIWSYLVLMYHHSLLLLFAIVLYYEVEMLNYYCVKNILLSVYAISRVFNIIFYICKLLWVHKSTLSVEFTKVPRVYMNSQVWQLDCDGSVIFPL